MVTATLPNLKTNTKVSEILKQETREQCRKVLYQDQKVCALGSLLQDDMKNKNACYNLLQRYPFLGKTGPCPVCSHRRELFVLIAHLNDDHFWTFNQIADWIVPYEV